MNRTLLGPDDDRGNSEQLHGHDLAYSSHDNTATTALLCRLLGLGRARFFHGAARFGRGSRRWRDDSLVTHTARHRCGNLRHGAVAASRRARTTRDGRAARTLQWPRFGGGIVVREDLWSGRVDL